MNSGKEKEMWHGFHNHVPASCRKMILRKCTSRLGERNYNVPVSLYFLSLLCSYKILIMLKTWHAVLLLFTFSHTFTWQYIAQSKPGSIKHESKLSPFKSDRRLYLPAEEQIKAKRRLLMLCDISLV